MTAVDYIDKIDMLNIKWSNPRCVASLKDGGKIVNNSYIMYADETVISIRRI
jgi:hypothetical protein